MPAPPDAVRVLVVEDDKALADTIRDVLERKGHAISLAYSGKAGAALIKAEDFDVVLTDLRLGDLDGFSIVKLVRELQPEAEVSVVSGVNDIRNLQTAKKLGATDFILKPIEMDELRAIVEKSAERVRLSKANRDLRQQLDEKFGFEGLIGSGAKMRRVVQLLKAFAPAPAPVLIFGDNGTGKELAAKALHVNSPRRTKPFVAMNCAALNENLLDDEMFGHEPGAYTGGDKRRIGRFEHAHGGTLFLDEIGDMPTTLQAKLLRVLENGEVVRIGANDPIKVDVRVIAATNKDLDGMVEKGEFRRDLYQRLKVGVIRLPSLAERREDVPLLVDHFTKDLAAKYGKAITALADSIRRAFALYAWPGNVRELRNLLEGMILLDHDGILGADDLPEESGIASHLPAEAGGHVPIGAGHGNDHLLGRPMEEVERYYIERALELTDNNREETAKILGIGERTLYRKLQEWKKEATTGGS